MCLFLYLKGAVSAVLKTKKDREFQDKHHDASSNASDVSSFTPSEMHLLGVPPSGMLTKLYFDSVLPLNK